MSAKETTERQRLLERWAELEPERCKVNEWPSRSFVHLIRQSQDWMLDDDGDDVLLGALIEAVTARGWTLTIDCDRDEAYADVSEKGDPPLSSAVATAPADALLAAYLQALKAETK